MSRKISQERLDNLAKVLRTRALTVAQLAAMYHCTPPSIRTLVAALEESGVKVRREPAPPTGLRGRPAVAMSVD